MGGEEMSEITLSRHVCARVLKLSGTSAPSLAELLASVSPLAFEVAGKTLEAYERSSAAAAD
jgi:hypothetical protein